MIKEWGKINEMGKRPSQEPYKADDASEEGHMNSEGWKSKTEEETSQQEPCQDDEGWEGGQMIHVGWEISRDLSNSPHDTGTVVDREKMYATQWTERYEEKYSPVVSGNKTKFGMDTTIFTQWKQEDSYVVILTFT